MSVDRAMKMKDIAERKAVIDKYNMTHTVDRERVIKMLSDKKMEDPRILNATSAVQIVKGSIPYEQVSDQSLIGEVKFQIAILAGELKDSD